MVPTERERERYIYIYIYKVNHPETVWKTGAVSSTDEGGVQLSLRSLN